MSINKTISVKGGSLPPFPLTLFSFSLFADRETAPSHIQNAKDLSCSFEERSSSLGLFRTLRHNEARRCILACLGAVLSTLRETGKTASPSCVGADSTVYSWVGGGVNAGYVGR